MTRKTNRVTIRMDYAIIRKEFVRRQSNCLAMARTHAPASNLMKTRGGAPRDFLKLLPCQNIFDPI
ncbi:MAG: hypothetical protein DME91_01105, partial [Verrucomicrobia bacterium]